LIKNHASSVLISEDQWLSELYPDEIYDISTYLKYSSRLKKVISSHVLMLLAKGLTVVLDFPANTKRQRVWFRSIMEQAQALHVLHYIDASDSKCKA
jgi:hypothetical protein